MRNIPSYLPSVSCPACFETPVQKDLHPEEARNSQSRYCDALICSACGVQEALTGFFWRDKALQRGFKLKVVS